MTRLTLSLAAGLVVACLTGSALANKPSSTVAKERSAKKACATGDFAKGVDLLADLYVDTNDPLWVYNQGRCYQQNNRWEQAISRFREYLRKAKNISESDRAETEQQIADCEQSMGKTSQVAPPTVAAPPLVTTPSPMATAPPVPSQPEKIPEATEQPASDLSSKPEQPPSTGSQGRGLRVGGITLAAVGVAAVGIGVGLALKANNLSTADYSRSREDERTSLKTWSSVSYGVGAAAIATGVVLYIVGWPREASSTVALVPGVHRDGASVSLNGRF